VPRPFRFANKPPATRFPVLLRATCFLLPMLLAGWLAWAWLAGSLPSASNIRLSSTWGDATVRRDSHGVVVIDGTTDRAAFHALGYVQAQDRLWQLEIERRIASGRMSEIAGGEMLTQDAWMRSLGLYAAADSAWHALGRREQESLQAYADGVNAWIGENHTLPIEFLATGTRPVPWTPIDSLAWSKVFALNLGGNMWAEIDRAVAARYLLPSQLATMGIQVGPDSGDLALSDTSWATLRENLENSVHIGGRYVGSNAWVLAGSRTRSGRPVLANDPHLSLQMPSLWYPAALRGHDIDVSGMTIVGLPVVVFGRNRDVAWGGTSLMADVQDLEVLTTNPRHPDEYLDGDAWRPLTVEYVEIRSMAAFPAFLRPPAKSATYRMRKSNEGPVVSDALDNGGPAMVLHWTGLEPSDRSYAALLSVNYARNWHDFVESFRDYVAPALNMVYADAQGNIGELAVGRIPVRGKGNGALPSQHWQQGEHWTGYVPYDEMPRRYNPPEGYLVTANNDPGGHRGYFLSLDFAEPYRAARIAALIEGLAHAGDGKATVDDMSRIQTDTFDGGAARLRKILTGVHTSEPPLSAAIDNLARWQGDMSMDSVGATLYTAWTRQLRHRLAELALPRLLGRQLDNAAMERLFAGLSDDRLADMLGNGSEAWCSGKRDGTEGCETLLLASLADALSELRREAGRDMDGWTFGRLHHAVYSHTLFNGLPTLAGIFEARVSSGGSQNAINVANAVYRKSRGYEQTFGAGFRQVIEPGLEREPGQWIMNSTGQSGNPLSAHYSDMVLPFRDGRLVPMPTHEIPGARR